MPTKTDLSNKPSSRSDVPIPGRSIDQTDEPKREPPTPQQQKDFAALAAAQAQYAQAVSNSPEQPSGQSQDTGSKTEERNEPDTPTEEYFEEEEDTVLNDLLEKDERTARLNNKERRRRIESSIRPLRPDDLDDHFEYRQVVDTGHLTFTFRSPSHGEVEEVYRRLMIENPSGFYAITKLSGMLTCIGTVDVCGKPLPSHLNDQGVFDRKKFEEKYQKFSSFPYQIIEDARVQFSWFDDRVSKMLSSGSLGNG